MGRIYNITACRSEGEMNTHAGHAPRGEISARSESMKSRLHSVKPLNLFGEISRRCHSVRRLGTQSARNSKIAIAGDKGGGSRVAGTGRHLL